MPSNEKMGKRDSCILARQPGQILLNLQNSEIAVGFYETCLRRVSEIPEVAHSFMRGLPQVSMETNIEPGGLISEAELYTALQS